MHNGNKYLTLVHTDGSKDALVEYEDLWKKIKYHIRSISNNLGGYDENIYENQIYLG